MNKKELCLDGVKVARLVKATKSGSTLDKQLPKDWMGDWVIIERKVSDEEMAKWNTKQKILYDVSLILDAQLGIDKKEE